jgi:hypothetical protein
LQSNACRELSKRRRSPPRRGRNARDARTRASGADAHSKAALARGGANPSDPGEAAPPEANGRLDQTVRRVEVAPRDQAQGGRKAAHTSAASSALQREAMGIVEMARRERRAPAIRRGSAGLTGLRARRVPQPVRVGRHDRTTGADRAQTSNRDRRAQARATETGRRAALETRVATARRRGSVASTAPTLSATEIVENGRRRHGTPVDRRASASSTGLRARRVRRLARGDRRDRMTGAARAQTSNQGRRARERVTEIGRKAPAAARAAKTDLRAVGPHHPGAAIPRGKDRRKAPAVHAGRRESRDR